MRLLGATVRVERCLLFLGKSKPGEIAQDLRGIIQDLTMQRDIRRYFRDELARLSRYLRFKSPGEKEIMEIRITLEKLRQRIPY